MRHARVTSRGVKAKAGIFFGCLAILFTVSFLTPLRPTSSLIEKRAHLTAFPTFSVESLASGKFFEDMDLWFSDTFPGRETMFKINDFVRSGYGIKSVEIHGTVEAGDDIPDAPFMG